MLHKLDFNQRIQQGMKSYSSVPFTRSSKTHGFSMVELLVAMMIGMFVTIAVFDVMKTSASKNKTTNTLSEVSKSGSFLLYQLDQYFRNAGYGFSNPQDLQGRNIYGVGCQLNVSLNNNQLMPGALPTPFNTLPATLRAAPVIIFDNGAGNGGDLVMSMSGNGGLSDVPFNIDSFSANSMNLTSSGGFRANDVVLLTDDVAGGPCLLSQVDAAFVARVSNVSVPLSGTYYRASINNQSITNMNNAFNLGQAPSFLVFGVGANNVLFMYDLLRRSAAGALDNTVNPAPYLESVYQMHAIYGVQDATGVLQWVTPTGNYNATALMDGSAAANTNIRNIKAIKLGVVMQSPVLEKTAVNNANLTLFADTPVPLQVNVANQRYRYKAFETTIPIRNSLL